MLSSALRLMVFWHRRARWLRIFERTSTSSGLYFNCRYTWVHYKRGVSIFREQREQIEFVGGTTVTTRHDLDSSRWKSFTFLLFRHPLCLAHQLAKTLQLSQTVACGSSRPQLEIVTNRNSLHSSSSFPRFRLSLSPPSPPSSAYPSSSYSRLSISPSHSPGSPFSFLALILAVAISLTLG